MSGVDGVYVVSYMDGVCGEVSGGVCGEVGGGVSGGVCGEVSGCGCAVDGQCGHMMYRPVTWKQPGKWPI